jgi:hypothetical protein
MVLARPPQRDGDHEPRDPDVEQHVAGRQDDPDRSRHGDHVTQESQGIVSGHRVVLQVIDLCRRCTARGIDCRRAHRHPAVRKHDSQIHPESDHDQPRARQTPVDRGEGQQEAVGGREHHHRQPVVARRGCRLQQKPSERRRPPVHANAFERAEASTRDKSCQ